MMNTKLDLYPVSAVQRDLVAMEQVQKQYVHPDGTPLPILEEVTLALSYGETLAITGESGSGKSTMLALLAGLDRPDQGHIHINGINVTHLSEGEWSRFRAAHIGIIFQQFHLMPHLNAEENVRLPLELAGRSFSQSTIDDMLSLVHLSHRRHHLPGQLSGGECQRVAIARALIVEPLLLLADEPTGNLDAGTAQEVTELLFSLVARRKMGLLVVTHNQDLARRCDSVRQLRQGVLR